MGKRTDTDRLVTPTGDDHGKIKIIGVGGAGGNAVNHMIEQGIQGVEVYALNTDVQALNNSLAPNIIQIGELTTKGLGAGADPNVGLMAAQESRAKIRETISGCDMLFITGGMGGGTGTGAAGVIAAEAKDLGVVIVAVVSMPFSFEGRKRNAYAREGLKQLQQHVDSLIIIPNDKLRESLGSNVSLLDAFKTADDVLYNAIYSITSIITYPGHINVDFADVRTVMSSPGLSMIGTGVSSGEARAQDAVERALSCELLEDIDLKDAKGLLVCVTSNEDISLGEFAEIGDAVTQIAKSDAPVIIGTSIDPVMEGSLGVTIVATGFDVDVTTEKPSHSPSGAKIRRTKKKHQDLFKKSFNIDTASALKPGQVKDISGESPYKQKANAVKQHKKGRLNPKP
jgi:cell division protein FtsZ